MDQATTAKLRQPWTVVLAAGRSSRLGFPKQFLHFRGNTLIVGSTKTAQSLTGRRVIVVVGEHRTRMRAHLRRYAPAARVVVNPHWRDGMGTSLAAGIRALPAAADYALIMLCDQPLIDRAALRRLLHAAGTARSRIAATAYGARAGVPAVFPRRSFAALRQLQGDVGARELLNDAAAAFDVVTVDCPAAAIDIDAPDDVTALQQR